MALVDAVGAFAHAAESRRRERILYATDSVLSWGAQLTSLATSLSLPKEILLKVRLPQCIGVGDLITPEISCASLGASSLAPLLASTACTLWFMLPPASHREVYLASGPSLRVPAAAVGARLRVAISGVHAATPVVATSALPVIAVSPSHPDACVD